MIINPQEFEEATAFELYVLETVHPAIEENEKVSIDLRGSKTHITVSITDCLSAGPVNSLKDKLAPLLFGAAWKIIDLLVEFTLKGLKPEKKRWKIEEKEEYARSGKNDSCVLGCTDPVWSAVLYVYAATVQHRHCLVHRTAKVDATSGTLEGLDNNGNPLIPLTRDEQVALAKVSGLVARAIVEGGIDRRSEDHLKYYLDQLRPHTVLPAFGISRASVPVDIQLTLLQENGTFILDMNGVLARAQRTSHGTAHFNLLIDVPDGSGRRLFAKAEDCPPGKSSIDLSALPQWLQYR